MRNEGKGGMDCHLLKVLCALCLVIIVWLRLITLHYKIYYYKTFYGEGASDNLNSVKMI